MKVGTLGCALQVDVSCLRGLCWNGFLLSGSVLGEFGVNFDSEVELYT